MSHQQEFDFRSPEEIAEHKRIAEENAKVFEKMLHNDDYVYNKYVDFLLDLVPFRLGWRARNWPSNIRWWAKNTYQKIRYGVCDEDVYSLGYNIAIFVLPRLKYFKKKGKFGIPSCFLPRNFHLLEGEELDKAEAKAIKEMNDALDEMIFAFEYIIDGDKFCEIPECSVDRIRKDTSEYTIEEKEGWKEYFNKAAKFNERKENGLALFAKYYDILWI